METFRNHKPGDRVYLRGKHQQYATVTEMSASGLVWVITDKGLDLQVHPLHAERVGLTRPIKL